MIGLVVVAHGRLASELVAALEHVVGPQDAVQAVDIGASDEMGGCRQIILDAVEAADQGAGVIVVTDMFGGTPSNLAISLLDRPGVEVIAGGNLPLLIKLVERRAVDPLPQVVAQAADAGRHYIQVASSLLHRKPATASA